MSISGNSLLTGIGSNTATAGGNARPRFLNALDGSIRLIRSNPNDSVADGSIGRFSIPRAELAALYQESTAPDPITQLLRTSSGAWTGVGASNV